MDDKRINSNINKSHSIGYNANSSYLTGETIQTSVPYATNQANDFSSKVDEMDLRLTNDVDNVENSTSEWLSSAKTFLEQLRQANSEEIERLQDETANLENRYQEYLSNLHLNLEREELIKQLENQLQVLQMNEQFVSGLNQEDEINRLSEQISTLKKEEIEEKIQYIKEHSNEFELFIGIDFKEYNQKIAYNQYTIQELQAKDYQLRQQAKQLPYLELMMTEEYLNYTSTYSEASTQSMTYLENRNIESYLNEEQLTMFSYLYDKKGWSEAVKYLEAIEDSINQAKGMAEAQVFLSRITDEEGNVDAGELEYIFATMGKGLVNGIETFGEGIENLFDITSDGMITDNQYAQQFILQGLSELQKKGQISKYIDDTYQISTSIGNMLPGSIISMLTCGTFGQVLMGMSAAGNAKNEALTTMSDNKTLAYLYGVLNGTSEAVLGKLMGNIPGLNEGAKFAVTEILSEGAEEFIQTYADAGFKAMLYGEIPDLGELTEEGLQSFLYGCITSSIMTGSQATISFTINGVQHTYNNISDLINAYSDGKITSDATITTTNNMEFYDTNIKYNGNLINDPTDDSAIGFANYYTAKGITQIFRFSDASHIPDINSSFWTEFNNPELIQINVDGRMMTLDDAISYKMNYDLNAKGIGIDIENRRVVNNVTANFKTDLNGLIRYLVQQQGINATMKGLWYYVYGNDLSYIPEQIRTIVQHFSTETIEDLLTYEQIKTIADNDIKTTADIIKLNDLAEINLSDLENLLPNTLFETSDGRILTYDSVKKILTNNDSIKNKLLMSVKAVDAPILKARKLYYELNKVLHYNMNYVKGDEVVKQSILDEEASFDNLNPYNVVVCKGWSELYRELLISAGFDESQVKIVGNRHRWVEIDLGYGSIISADATDVINGSIDLANCKAGMPTNGFMILNRDNSGLRLSNIYEYSENKAFIEKQQNSMKKFDRTLGYVGDNGYLMDEINKANELFSNSKASNDLFAKIDLRKKVNSIFDIDIPTNMDGYEIFAYNRFLANKILGDESKLICQETLYKDNGDIIEPVNYMEWHDNETGELIIQVYSASLGKIRFTSLTDYSNFMKNYNWIK